MKFGVRECANIVFRAKQPTDIGVSHFEIGQPVLYIDSATTSSLEQAVSTVYATGGRGNSRLISWDGEKTVTFSFTDALLSPIGFGILAGAGLFKKGDGSENDNATKAPLNKDFVHFHMMSAANLSVDGTDAEINLTDAVADFKGNALICIDDAPIYIMEAEEDGSLTGNIFSGEISLDDAKSTVLKIANIKSTTGSTVKNASVMVDYYVDLPGQHVWEADITPETFGGNYYVEADTLFREQATGKDLPANLTFPNVKIQSNFTMTFAGTGDPSTFDFTMDAMPGYTYFDKSKKVLAVMQIIDSSIYGNTSGAADKPVMPHNDVLEHDDIFMGDSNEGFPDVEATSLTLKTDASIDIPIGGYQIVEIEAEPENATINWEFDKNEEYFSVVRAETVNNLRRFQVTRNKSNSGATITFKSGNQSVAVTIKTITQTTNP